MLDSVCRVYTYGANIFCSVMAQEIWNYVIPVIAGAASVVLDRSISLIVRTRAQKKRDRIKAESEELDMSEKEIRVERERADRAWAHNRTLEERIESLITEAENIRTELIEARREKFEIEAQRDLYRGLLGKLVKLVMATCGGSIDTSEYEQALVANA